MNYFELRAQQQMVAATKAKHRAAEKRAAAKLVKSERDAPMKPSALEQEQLDKNAQLKLWRAYHRDEINAVINGPYRDNWRELVRVVRDMAFENPGAIVGYVQHVQWLHDADIQTRRVALSMIARAIMQLREINGYPPFDDSLPGEEPTAFEIIRAALRVLT
jgi:hypothetical protein